MQLGKKNKWSMNEKFIMAILRCHYLYEKLKRIFWK